MNLKRLGVFFATQYNSFAVDDYRKAGAGFGAVAANTNRIRVRTKFQETWIWLNELTKKLVTIQVFLISFAVL